MHLTLKIKDADRILPDQQTLTEAAMRAVEVTVKRHLREKDASSTQKPGFPKSGYYMDAARNGINAYAQGKTAVVEIEKEGMALHYEGGTVLPKKKALAIPIDPSVADIWPSEAGGIATGDGYAMIWPKGSNHGFIKDAETNDLLWLLVPKATIPADKTVLPEDETILSAAEAAIWSCCA